jgi:hypothetical protein
MTVVLFICTMTSLFLKTSPPITAWTFLSLTGISEGNQPLRSPKGQIPSLRVL